jgi:hypothetical protein
MPDYSKGKIYKIWSPSHEEVGCYIGSTTQPLYKRFSSHKTRTSKKTNSCSSKILFEYEDTRIDLLEEYPCENREQLNAKEGEWIRKENCLNKNIAGRTLKEYYQDHKERIRQYQYENKDKIRERRKRFYLANKDELCEKARRYYEMNRERIIERVKKYN